MRACGRTGLRAARLAYVTPSHQFPLGSVMSAARRQELLAWARRAGAYVIEDDYDSEYRYDIAPDPALQTLDGAENVIYLGTVSKTLSPTLRLGYLVVPPALRAAFGKAKRLADRHTPAWSKRRWPSSSRAAPMSGMSGGSAGRTASGGRPCWPPFHGQWATR